MSLPGQGRMRTGWAIREFFYCYGLTKDSFEEGNCIAQFANIDRPGFSTKLKWATYNFPPTSALLCDEVRDDGDHALPRA